MPDRLRCLVVAAAAAAVLALPAGAAAAKPGGKQACRSSAHKAKAKPARRCQSRPRPQSRGTDPEHVAPAAIMDAGPATRAGAVLEI